MTRIKSLNLFMLKMSFFLLLMSRDFLLLFPRKSTIYDVDDIKLFNVDGYSFDR